MITPLIERELISGRARYLTHMHACTGVSKIEIPANNFAIVLDIIAWPFSDPDTTYAKANAVDLDYRGTHIVELTNQESGRIGFIYRNTPVITSDGDTNVIGNGQPVYFHPYLVRNKSFYCQVGTFEGPPTAIANDIGTLQANTQNPPNVKGYGGGVGGSSVLVDIQAGDGSYYSPCKEEGLPVAGAGGNLYFDQPFPYYGGVGALNIKANYDPIYNGQTPLVQVNYVLMNIELLKNFQ